MDPNATLDQLRELIEPLRSAEDASWQTVEMIELFDALDGWLSSGGFLPDAWQR